MYLEIGFLCCVLDMVHSLWKIKNGCKIHLITHVGSTRGGTAVRILLFGLFHGLVWPFWILFMGVEIAMWAWKSK